MTTGVPIAADVEFKSDAMLMYGWVADAERRVVHVSNSLRRWIRANQQLAPDANRLLDDIDASADVALRDFLQSLLDPSTEPDTAAVVTGYTTRLAELVNAQIPKDRHPWTETVREYNVLMQYHAPRDGAQPLAGARFVRDSATLLASRWNMQRVDIVIVAIAEYDGGRWVVRGFQGQLQEAWLRVKNRIVDGNRAGGIALMARNMSHNIGSHALYWVASAAEPDHERFLRYLQARMELLAGFATKIPLSPVTAKLDKIVARFNATRLLLENICRSEHVSSIRVELEGYRDDVIFFGGEAGIQAFYSVLENCIRDSAKHAPRDRQRPDHLTMKVVAKAFDDHVQLDVYDQSKNYHSDGPELRRIVEQIRLADERGALDPRHWGVKERFICAAMLRGMRPEDFPLQESAAPNAPQLGTYRKDGRRVMELIEVDGNCSWRFFLPRHQAEVLLVTGQEATPLQPGVVAQRPATFAANANTTSGIVMPFVVLDQLPPDMDTNNLKGALPHRTYVRGDLDLPQKFLRIDDPLQSISSTVLLRRSVDALTRGDVRLIIGINPGERVKQLQFSDERSDDPFLIIDNETVDSTIMKLHAANPQQRLMVYKRHPSNLHDRLQAGAERDCGVEHFEIYGVDAYLAAAVLALRDDRERGALRLLEAALTRVLIIDERLDLDLTNERLRSLLRLRGITLRGREFVSHFTREYPTTLEAVGQWVKGFHAVVVHRGVAEKLYADDTTPEQVIATLEGDGALLAIHSGRMGAYELPKRTRLLPLANVAAWINNDYSKLQIIDELFSLRGV